MDFGQAIKSVLTQYATFSGRATRAEFWWFYLFGALVAFGINIIDTVLRVVTGYTGLSYVLALALVVPTLAVSARRLHDSGRSGWWLLGIYLAPVVGFVAMVGGLVLGLVVGLGNTFNEGEDANVGVFVVIGLAGLALMIAGAVVWLVQMLRPSDPRDNRYGPTTVVQPTFPVPGGYGSYPSPYGAPGPPASQAHPPQPPVYPPAPPEQRPPGTD